MIAVKGVYDGKGVELLDPLPKKQAQKNFWVIVTFVEEKKVSTSTKHAVGINEGITNKDQLQAIASYRFPLTKQRRMDKLLDKGNAGNLTIKERRELDRLVLDTIRRKASRSHIKNTQKVGSNGR